MAILALLRSAPMWGEHIDTSLSERIAAQVQGTLALADDFVLRLRADMPDRAWQDVELGQLLYEVRERALPLARARSITLDLDTTRADPDGAGYWVQGDPQLLDRAVFNLVENAIKYGRSGGWVRLSLERRTYQGEWLAVTVADNGRGIAPADMGAVFERYARVRQSDTDAPSGHGLGLALVKAVAEGHGGRARCHSTPEQGSVFEVELPLA